MSEKLKKGIFVNKDSMVYITYSKYLKDKTKAIINEENVHKTNINLVISLNNESQMEVKACCELLEKPVHYTSREKFEKAKNKPLSKNTITQQFQKTGNTNYTINNITYQNFGKYIHMLNLQH